MKKDINLLEMFWKGQVKGRKEGKVNILKEKYRVEKKGLKTVIEELKQRIIAKAAKITRYE